MLPSEATAALSAVVEHEGDAELRRIRTELASCHAELTKYREMLPDFVPTAPPSLHSNLCCTITLKARSEFPGNCDNLKVASILNTDVGRVVKSFAFNESPFQNGCAWLLIKFAIDSMDEQRLQGLCNAVACFLARIQTLEDCHRICQTMNFIDEYDGDWSGEPAERANQILAHLPAKIQVEAL